MQIQNKFQVPLPPEQAWIFLMNIQEVAPCFPGVELTETIDGDTQKGRIKVKLGPVSMIFAGTVHFESRDKGALSASVKASWREEKGRGSATTMTRFKLTECDGGTEVFIDSDVQLAGQVAQYGRGLGMISEMSAQLIARFADNLREKAKSVHVEVENQTKSQDGNRPVTPQYRSEISGLSLLWSVIVARLKSLFTS